MKKKKYIWFFEILVWLLIISIGLFTFIYNTSVKNNVKNSLYIFFDDVDGLVKGSPVRLMGINIGYVRDVKIFDNKVFISFLVTKENIQIPKRATATIEFYGLGGSTSLELNPATASEASNEEMILQGESYRVQDFWDGQKLVSNVLIDIYGGMGRTIQNADLLNNKDLLKQSKLVKDITKEFDGTCRRIVDIKKLDSGTEFTYVGDATTTFTDYENGILIQDYTGGILLKNAKLGDNGGAEIESGMLITNIKGKYYPASGDVLSCIEISDMDIANIVVKEEKVDFECRNSDANFINIFYDKYLEGEALVFVGANITESTSGDYVITFSYYEGSTEQIITLPAIAKGNVDITKFELIGYARKFNGVLTFVIVGDRNSDKVDVENEIMIRDVFISSDGELFAPEAAELMVYDINGRVVAIAESSYLDLTSLNRGVYLVRSVYNDSTTQIIKIIR